jgi:Ca2+-binding RTX toxin-like protein
MGLAGVKVKGARVAVFDHADYVDTANLADSESDNVQISLAEFDGHDVTPFTDLSGIGFAEALTNQQVLLVPDLEFKNLAPDLTEDAKDEVRDFVSGGGTMVVHGDDNGNFTSLLNELFGTSVAIGAIYESEEARPTYTRRPAANGTTFADDPDSLEGNNGTYSLNKDSLPDNARVLYGNSNDAAVVIIPYGTGQVVFIAWDWYDPAADGQDDGWFDILDSAVSLRSGKKLSGNAGDNVFDAQDATKYGDAINGKGGDDQLSGGDGFDLLNGGKGDDRMRGGDGNDQLNGGLGNNKLTGGDGGDNFIFNAFGLGAINTITDFEVTIDVMTLDAAAGFDGLDPGVLLPGQLEIGGAAISSEARIIYNDLTGDLYFDVDGKDGEAAVLFGKIGLGLALSNADFFVHSFLS